MSLLNPTLKNPSSVFMKWRGGADNVGTKDEPEYEGGRVTYWQKGLQPGEGEEIEVDLPLRFTVLNVLHTITGFNEKENAGFWSNEVDDLRKELIVRTKSGIVARGPYAKIKDQIKSMGAKYAQSVYIAFKDESGELVIGNIQMAGAALRSWIEFQKKFDIEVAAVKMECNPKVQKKGKTFYFIPSFDGMNLNEQTKKDALVLARELQNYLDAYMARKHDVEDDLDATEIDEEEDQDDIHNIDGLDNNSHTKEDGSPLEGDEDDDEEEPAPKKKAAVKKSEKLNVQDVEF